MDTAQVLAGIGIMAAGVLVAGYIMATSRKSVPFIDKAHEGFDSFL